MVHAEDAIDLYRRLTANHNQIWLTGGWGIDALLGKQTRPHKDLDIIMLLDDVVRLRERLSGDGYDLKELWSENRQAVDARGIETPTAFVLRDAAGREIDVHAMQIDTHGNGLPAWIDDAGLIFKPIDLGGEGVIAGLPVHCLSAEMQVVCHTGYALPDAQRRDLDRLRAKFGVEYPRASA